MERKGNLIYKPLSAKLSLKILKAYLIVIPDRLLREECQEFMSNKQVEHRVAIHRFLSEVLEPLVPEVHLWLL